MTEAGKMGSDSPEVLFVCGTFQMGGTERHLLTMAEALVRRGWRISVYGLSGFGELLAAFEKTGATIIQPPIAYDGEEMSLPRRIHHLVRAAVRLYFILRARRPQIVHFFLPKAYLVGAPIAMLAGVPIKIMSRRSLNDYQAGHPIFRQLELRLHHRMTAILGNARSVVRQLRDQEGVPSERLGLIYSGIDAGKFHKTGLSAEGRSALGLAPGTLALIIVANLIAYKGHSDLLRALVLAKPHLPLDWRLFIVGRDDGIGNDLRAQVAAAGLDKNVVFLGERSDVPALYSACDIGLLCSHQEGLSNVILEGMAAGLPMIVTDVGGNPELVLDGETGLVVPPRSPQQLADAIIRLANDPALRERLGAAGHRRVAENFTLEQCAERYDSLYRALLRGRLPKDLP